MFQTPKIEGKIDLFLGERSVKKLPGKTSQGDCGQPHNVAWDSPIDSFG